MSNVAKVAGAAANTLTTPLNVEEVFSTYLYTGNGTARSITNGIDVSGEGGLVWIKTRETATYSNNMLYDTENGANYFLRTNGTNALTTASGFGLTAFNSDGFDMGTAYGNESGIDTASWTFRKAPKFFDVVTYTGNSTAGRTISHNLGSAPGMIIIKNVDVAVPWAVYHRSMGDGVGGGADENFYMNLNEDFARAASSSYWNNTAPTSTTFTLGTANRVNATGSTYVAYLFAHNNGDGDFGPDADADIIKCGSYTGNGNTNGPTVDLGFEPQWVLIKRADSTGPWNLHDSMRNLTVSGYAYLRPNVTDAEASTTTVAGLDPLPNGFKVRLSGTFWNASGGTYIYIAIRRGPMAVPESAADVFAIDTKTTPEPAYNSGFVVDMAIQRNISVATSNQTTSRLMQKKRLLTDSTNAEETSATFMFDYNTGWSSDASFNDANNYSWMWKRAPNYFDVVAYTGNGTPNNHAPTLTHNLGVVPEMIWVKKRNGTSNWAVVVKSGTGGIQAYLDLNNGNVGTLATTGPSNTWSDYFTSTQVIGDGGSGNAFHSPFPVTNLNVSGNTHIMYLFASLAGVSKVGSYTGNGTNQTINCGFSAGARFILIKRTDASGDWYVWDTERGIVAANDPHLSLNTTAAEVTTDDSVDPDNSGFIVNQVSATNINVSSATYIFYAIA